MNCTDKELLYGAYRSQQVYNLENELDAGESKALFCSTFSLIQLICCINYNLPRNERIKRGAAFTRLTTESLLRVVLFSSQATLLLNMPVSF